MRIFEISHVRMKHKKNVKRYFLRSTESSMGSKRGKEKDYLTVAGQIIGLYDCIREPFMVYYSNQSMKHSY